MMFAGTVYDPESAATPVARVMSVVRAFGFEFVIRRSIREGSVMLTDHEMRSGCVGSIPDPEVGDVNSKAKADEMSAARQAPRREGQRIDSDRLGPRPWRWMNSRAKGIRDAVLGCT